MLKPSKNKPVKAGLVLKPKDKTIGIQKRNALLYCGFNSNKTNKRSVR